MNAKLLNFLTKIKEFFCKFFCGDKCHNCKDCKDCKEMKFMWENVIKKCEKCREGATKTYEI